MCSDECQEPRHLLPGPVLAPLCPAQDGLHHGLLPGHQQGVPAEDGGEAGGGHSGEQGRPHSWHKVALYIVDKVINPEEEGEIGDYSSTAGI